MGEIPGWMLGVAVLLFALGAGAGIGLWLFFRGVGHAARATGAAAAEVVRSPADAAVELARGIADVFRDTFQSQPEIRIENVVVHEGSRDVLQLLVMERTVREHKRWSDRRWLSEKQVAVTGVYTAKIGFDLTQLRIEVRRAPLAMRVTLPPARVLALQNDRLQFDGEKSGLWNRVSADDRNRVLAELQQDAAASVERSDDLAAARRRLVGFFEEQARLRGVPLEIADAREPLQVTG